MNIEQEKRIHLSPALATRIDHARYNAEKCINQGNKKGALWWNTLAITLLNTGSIEALEDTHVYEDEVVMYMDISGDLGKLDNKDLQRTLELHMIAGTPLYTDVIELLKKHLTDGRKEA